MISNNLFFLNLRFYFLIVAESLTCFKESSIILKLSFFVSALRSRMKKPSNWLDALLWPPNPGSLLWPARWGWEFLFLEPLDPVCRSSSRSTDSLLSKGNSGLGSLLDATLLGWIFIFCFWGGATDFSDLFLLSAEGFSISSFSITSFFIDFIHLNIF